MRDKMRFHVFASDFQNLGQFNAYQYAEWREDYADTGRLHLKCVDTEENVRLMQPGNFLYRRDIGRAMVIRQVIYDQAKSGVEVRGYSTTDLLSQRVVNPSAASHTMEVYNAEQGIYDIINANMRGVNRFATAPAKGFLEVIDTQFTGANVLNAVVSLAEEAGFGLAANFDYENSRHEFEVYKGLDRTFGNGVNRPIVFSDNPKNVNNLTITKDTSAYRNLVYVAGEGEGEARVVVAVPDISIDPDAVIPEGNNRFELWLDQRNLQRGNMTLARYRQLLYAKGIEAINQRLSILSFSCDPITEGSYRFRTDYALGDVVTCESKKYGIRFNTRVEQYAEITQHNGTILKIQLGKPIYYRVREDT